MKSAVFAQQTFATILKQSEPVLFLSGLEAVDSLELPLFLWHKIPLRHDLYQLDEMFTPYNAELILYKSWRPKGYFQFDIIIDVLVSSFWFIWIPMLWGYGHQNIFYSYSAGIDFSHQNLTSTDVRIWRLKSILAVKISSHLLVLVSDVSKFGQRPNY